MPMTYDDFKQLGMRLDMSRGKPAPEQLELSRALLEEAGTTGFLSRDGIDCRNYGHLLGLPEARELGAALLEVPAAQVVAGGNSSLELMHDVLAFAMLFGVPGGEPWRKSDHSRLFGRAIEQAGLDPVEVTAFACPPRRRAAWRTAVRKTSSRVWVDNKAPRVCPEALKRATLTVVRNSTPKT